MAIKRKGSAVWNGTGKEGKGILNTQSGTLSDVQYSYVDRFADGTGTNPEELIAAAHAGCFSMKLAFNLTDAGFTPSEIKTEAEVSLAEGSINQINLTTTVKAPNLSNEKLQELAIHAKENCPVSKLLKANIFLTATLG